MDFESERVKKLPSTDLSVFQGVNLSSNLKVKPHFPPRLGKDPLKRRFGKNDEFLDTSELVTFILIDMILGLKMLAS